jgi:Protein of unknown function (DUF938)
MTSTRDTRQYAPATERNRQFILDVLLRVLPTKGDILEIASGTGEHAVFFAPHFKPRLWIPSDPNPQAIASIASWREHAAIENLHSPIEIDVRQSQWYLPNNLMASAIVCINMIHIAPWSACVGLITGASNLLVSGGILYLYGPYKRDGEHTAPSNLAFDRSLRDRNPEWGVRDLEHVVSFANDLGWHLSEVVEMPANNLSVVFKKS